MQDDRTKLAATIGTLALCLVAGTSATAEAACPPGLSMWETLGAAEPGSEWSVRILDAQEDVATVRQLTIRLADPELSPEHAPWFAVPSVLLPDAFFVASQDLEGETLDSFCRRLDEAGLDVLRDRSRSRCVLRDGKTIIETAGTTVAGGAAGLSLRSPQGTTEDDCYPEDILPLLEDRLPPPDPPEHSRALERGRELLDRWIRQRPPVVSGPIAVPAARSLLDRLAELGPDAVPPDLPSVFSLEISVADLDLGAALALETIESGEAADVEVALGWLGDHPSPRATTLLRVRLRRAVAARESHLASLALRALLAADRSAAQLESVPLLLSPTCGRAALGVFAVTDPPMRKDLVSIDADDPDAAREAALRVLRLLQGSDDEELADAARAALGNAPLQHQTAPARAR